ncbi:MAG: sulfurtransferase TusA family protein [Myxococcales bacterium]|nr:sulfurtransferase TusA family protein [Myxococcales bacterium]MDD9967179.1 sulfurtransferase TusA family protein [Myxococcales bacterium]
MATQQLDCKGLNCPMPIVKISKAIKKIGAGDRLEVEASDPAFQADVEAWSKKTGHALVEFTDGEVKRAVIEKAA